MPALETVVTAAIEQIDQGFAVFALLADAKVPVTKNGFKNATTRPDWIRRQLEAPAAGNYGLVWPQDSPECVVVFDLDDGGGADRPWRDRVLDLVAKYGPLPATKTTTTPSGGRHAFYRWPSDVPIPSGDELFGFTVRWPGRGYLVGPGSRIGEREYVPGPVAEIAQLPQGWVNAAAREHGLPRTNHAADTITISGGYALPDHIPSGRRYAAVRDYVASRYNALLSVDEMWELVRTQVAPRFETPKTEQELRADFDRVTAKLAERLGPPAGAAVAAPKRVIGPGMDAADLLALDLPPLRWVVPELVPEGTTILAAPPKVGKSCLVYQIAVEASIGGELLGRRVTSGSVLYLALEDGKRRGQDRLRAALAGRTMPRGRLEVRWDANNIGEGLEQDIEGWLDEHPDAVMVAIDTLGKVRPHGDGRRNAYEVDVQHLARLQDLFRDRPVALVIVHHARKEANDDFLASVSGTYGLTGSADTIVVLRRKRLDAFGTVLVTGRDIADAELSVRFTGLAWESAPGALPEASFERTEVYTVIEERGPIFPQAIANLIGKSRTNVQNMVDGLVRKGAVARVDHGYVVAGVVIDDGQNARFPLSLPSDSNDLESHQSHSGHTRAGAREGSSLRVVPDATRPGVDCEFYLDHQSQHFNTPTGWRCRICSPEEAPA